MTARSAISENSVSSGVLWRAKLSPLSEKKSSKKSPKKSSNRRCWSEKAYGIGIFQYILENSDGKYGWKSISYRLIFPKLSKNPDIYEKVSSIKSSNRRCWSEKTYGNWIFQYIWRLLMGNTISKAYYIVFWYFRNWAKLRKKIVKKNRQIGADGADGRLCRQKINVTTRYRLIG